MILIKRYTNRKLYNTNIRKYVTLDEIANLLQLGEEVQVIDHPTGEDITTATLTQILAQQEKTVTGSVPQDMLQRMVQLSGLTLNAMKESIQAFLANLNESVQVTNSYKEQAAELATNVKALNQVYGNMLSAMNVNR